MFIIAGLSGDYNMNPIGDIIKLVPVADEIIKLKALCVYCKNGTPASFTKKEIDNQKQILVGGSEIYSPVCRKHFTDTKVC
jgi:thymidine kinase